jgi:hypothetical protein
LSLPRLLSNEQRPVLPRRILLCRVLAPQFQPIPFAWILDVLATLGLDDPNRTGDVADDEVGEVVADDSAIRRLVFQRKPVAWLFF